MNFKRKTTFHHPIVDDQRKGGESTETSHFIQSSFHEKILEFEALVKECEKDSVKKLQQCDDPVVIWTNYIDFITSNFPRDEDAVYQIRKRATRALIPIERYANDVRFLRICIFAADSSPRPLDDFQGLYNLGIGLKMACFWMVWAFKAESLKEYHTATAIYLMAIKHKAVPVNIVRERYIAYKNKMRNLGIDYDPRKKKITNPVSQGSFQTDLSDFSSTSCKSYGSGWKRRRVTLSPLVDISNGMPVIRYSGSLSEKEHRPLHLQSFNTDSPSFEMFRAISKRYKIFEDCKRNFNLLVHSFIYHQVLGISYNDIHTVNVDDAIRCLLDNAYSRENISSGKIIFCHHKLSIPTKQTNKLKKRKETLTLHGVQYTIARALGEGHYGTVLLLESNNAAKIALKAQKPASCLCWEYLILERLQKRLAINQMYPFPQPISFTLFQDGAALAMSVLSETGFTLLDVVNVYKGNVPELLVIYYTHQLFQILQLLHIKCEILHCDIKPDQIVVKYNEENTSPTLMLVDFGRALDLKVISEETPLPRFIGNICASGMGCISMRNNVAWSYDVDLFGVVMSAFTILFGEYVDLKQSDRCVRLSKPFKRYWATDLWYLLLDSVSSYGTCHYKDHVELLHRIERAFHCNIECRRRELEVLLKDQVRLFVRQEMRK